MPLTISKKVTASALKAPGPILDAARDGAVTITRRTEEFVIVSRHRLDALLAEAADPRPRTLEDLVSGYDPGSAREALGSWLDDPPSGREAL